MSDTVTKPEAPLFLLAFDHRSSFERKLHRITGSPTNEDLAQIRAEKQIIFGGFKKAVAAGVPKEHAAILVDEQYGDAVLREAGQSGFTLAVPVEKSGQEEFDLEYGQNFPIHILKYKPAFAKALVRYNPENNRERNQRQAQRLKSVSDFCRRQAIGFMIEPLIPPTENQLESVEKDMTRFDEELRPALAVEMIRELQMLGVEPDIWKIEGFSKTEDYRSVVAQAQTEGRRGVGVIVLGRGADVNQVESWLRAGAAAPGVSGFAIGRTIFWQALVDYRNGHKTAEKAAAQICKNYLHFYNIFSGKELNNIVV